MSFIKAEKPHLLEEIVYFDSGFRLKLFILSKHLQINTSPIVGAQARCSEHPEVTGTLRFHGSPVDAPNKQSTKESREFQQHSCDELEKEIHTFQPENTELKGKRYRK